MMKKYVILENELIEKYRIIVLPHSKCYGRTHAHCDGSRRICKYTQQNSIQSLFTLAHEIGHIMTKTSNMRRCESEYYATVWAIQELKKYNIDIPISTINKYQDYIDRELDRGVRRGGKNYSNNLDLSKADEIDLKVKSLPSNKKWLEIQKRNSDMIKSRRRLLV